MDGRPAEKHFSTVPRRLDCQSVSAFRDVDVLLKIHTRQDAILELKIDLNQFMLIQCTLVLAPEVHCYYRQRGHLNHHVVSLCCVEKRAPQMIAVLVDLSVLALMVIFLVYRFVHLRILSRSCSPVNLECSSAFSSLVTTIAAKVHCLLRI